MSKPATTADLDAIDLTSRIAEIRRLLAKERAAPDFFRELVEILCADSASAGAAVWMMSESRSLGLYAESGLTQTGILNDPRATATHQRALVEGCLASEPVVQVNPLKEFCPAATLCLVPIRQHDKPVGVIEFFAGVSSEGDPVDEEALPAQLGEVADCVQRFLDRIEVSRRELDPLVSLERFQEFSAQLHGSLDATRVHDVAANELRLLCHSDRVTTLEVDRRRIRVRAVSGQSRVNRHSRQVQMLQEVVASVSRTGERFVFPHSQSRLPERLLQMMSDYLTETSVQMVLVEPVQQQPLHPMRGEPSSATPRREQMAAVVFEQFGDSLPHPALLKTAGPACRQFGLAIGNARRHSRLQWVPGLSLIGNGREKLTQSRWLTALALLTTLFIGGWSLLAVETDLQVECRGHLMPVHRQHVFAPVEGEIAQVFVTEAQQVSAGEPLLQLRSSDLDANVLQLSSQIRQKMKQRESIRADLRSANASPARDRSTRLQADYEGLASEIATLEDQLKLMLAEQDKLVVRAPFAGTITSPRPREYLLNKPVARGEHLLELMSEDGPWRLELELPERRAGHLLEAAGREPVAVDYRLAAAPEQVWQGHVSSVGDRMVLSTDYGTAMTVYCDIQDDRFSQRRIGMDVHARVNCGSRSLMFVWFGELREYLHRRWWL